MAHRPDWRAWWSLAVRKLTHNWAMKLASIAFASALWGFVNLGAREADRSLLVPLELRNLPSQLTITNPVPDAVSVRVRGPRTILGTIDEGRKRFAIDLSSVGTGASSVKIDAGTLNLPRGVTVMQLSPVELTLDVDRIIEKRLPIVTNVAAAVPTGYRVLDSDVRPPTVVVTGPAAQVEPLRTIATGPLQLKAANGNFEESVPLERPTDLARLSPERVTVRGVLEEIVATQDFRNVEIGVRNAPQEYKMQPRTVDVSVRGPQRLIKDLRLSAQNLYVDFAGVEPGVHAARVGVVAPPGVEVLEVRPPEITVVLPGEAAPAAKRRAKGAKPR